MYKNLEWNDICWVVYIKLFIFFPLLITSNTIKCLEMINSCKSCGQTVKALLRFYRMQHHKTNYCTVLISYSGNTTLHKTALCKICTLIKIQPVYSYVFGILFYCLACLLAHILYSISSIVFSSNHIYDLKNNLSTVQRWHICRG